MQPIHGYALHTDTIGLYTWKSMTNTKVKKEYILYFNEKDNPDLLSKLKDYYEKNKKLLFIYNQIKRKGYPPEAL